MNKKILILFISLFILCSGCTAEYTLEIKEDLTVKESFTAMEDADFYNSYEYSSAQEVIGFMLEPNLDYLNKNGFGISQILNKKEAGVKVENTYGSIKEFKEKSKVPEQLSEEWSYVESEDSITLSIKGSFHHAEQSQDGLYSIHDARIKLIIPFEVTSHNADSFNRDTHSYVWNFDEETEEKEIKITFNKNLIKKDENSNFPYIIIGIVVVVGLILFIGISGFITGNKNRNNLED